MSYANIYRNKKYISVELEYEIENPSRINDFFEIHCFPYLDTRTEYDNIYLSPCYSPVKIVTPFEIIIDNIIKGVDEDEYYISVSVSKFINYTLSSLLLIFFYLALN